MIGTFTYLEIILLALLWIFIGCWICYKRDWYKKGFSGYANNSGEQELRCLCAVVFMPFNLIWTIIITYIYEDWNNNYED